MQKATNELRIIEEKETGMLNFSKKLKVVENFMRLLQRVKETKLNYKFQNSK